jgi:hypothetical protein
LGIVRVYGGIAFGNIRICKKIYGANKNMNTWIYIPHGIEYDALRIS